MTRFNYTFADTRAAKNPRFAEELVEMVDELLNDVVSEMGEAAGQAAAEAANDAISGALTSVESEVADLIEDYAEDEGEDAGPVVPDDPELRPRPVQADASATGLHWESPLSLLSTESLENNPTERFRTGTSTCRTISPLPSCGRIEVYDNDPVPGRHLKMRAFEAAVYDAGGVITCRYGSRCSGEVRDCYPHDALGRPDGDGWTLYYLIGLLSARQVRDLVETHLGPLNEAGTTATAA